jgi:hypothetical protein
MIDCRFKPINAWPSKPTPGEQRKRSPFKSGWQKTLDLLEAELNHLDAGSIAIEGFFSLGDIRNDGWPKSGARPTQPGVIVSFDTKQGRMVMPCDTYTHWEANVRAIALTLECLRAVKRYGATSERQEQYTGWLKLKPASLHDEAAERAKELIKFALFECTPVELLASRELFERVAADALRKTHSDTGNGNVGDFQAALAARNRIREMRGWM